MTAERIHTASSAEGECGDPPHAEREAIARAALAAVLGAVAVAPELADKHRHATRSLAGKIGGGFLIWLLVSALIFGAIMGVAWLARELRVRGHTRLSAEPASWLASLAIGIALSGALYAHRAHFPYRQVGPRITSAILIALAFALALRLLLTLATFLLGPDRARDPWGT